MKKVILYLSILLATACEEATTLDFPEEPPTLVIEGKITNQPGPYLVKVGLSSPFSDSIKNIPITDAQIHLSDDLGNREHLQLYQPGIYRTDAIQGKIGRTYTLEVEYKGQMYTASSFLGPVGRIDSIVQTFRKESLLWEEGYHASLYQQKSIQNKVNYYRWHILKNDSLFRGRNYFYVDSDEFVATLKGLEFDYPFSPGDTVKCESESLTKEVFDYYIQLNVIINGDGFINKFRHINPPTNFSPPILGVFQASAIQTKQLIITKK